jgi:Dissimilatory sulfite reductase (desulfoviridin), alpha and beta subunits
MKINQDLCVGCGTCVPYCPINAIKLNYTASINLDECVECHLCYRSGVCPTSAFEQEKLEWPREIRAIFSDVCYVAPNTGVGGRGTEEMKTNDVTGRLTKDRVGVCVELGRPNIGVRMYDVEKIVMKLAEHGIVFEPQNPVDMLIQDKKTGKFFPEVLNERALSAIVETEIDNSRLKEILQAILDVAKDLDTVFSLDAATVLVDGEIPIDETLKELGITRRPNGKTNIGLGKPKKEVI